MSVVTPRRVLLACCACPARFVYAACAVRPTNANNAVAKFDTQEKTYKVGAPECGLLDCGGGGAARSRPRHHAMP